MSTLPIYSRLISFGHKHGLATLGQVLDHPDLPDGKTFRRKAAASLLELVAACAAPDPAPNLLGAETLVHAFQTVLARLNERERDILERRSGMRGENQTLVAIGKHYGVSRERIRQWEVWALAQLSAPGLAEAIVERVQTLWNGQVIDISDPQVSWLCDAHHDPRGNVFRFVAEHLLPADRRPHLVKVLERHYFMPIDADAFDKLWREARTRLSKLSFPAPRERLVAALRAPDHLPGLAHALWHLANSGIRWDAREERALAYGHTYHAHVLALLRASPKPMAVTELFAKAGRSNLPDDVIYFAHGRLGLEQHYPDLASHYEQFAPHCVDRIQSAPERQWHAKDLLAHLAVKGLSIPSSFTHWHLTALLKRHPELFYLGRHCFVHKQVGQASRIQYQDALAQILRVAKRPLARAELKAELSKVRGVSQNGLSNALDSPRFVRQDGGWVLARSES